MRDRGFPVRVVANLGVGGTGGMLGGTACALRHDLWGPWGIRG